MPCGQLDEEGGGLPNLSLLDLIPWTLESKQRQKYPLVMF